MNLNLFKSQFKDKVEYLEKVAKQLPPHVRNELVEQLTEEHLKALGKYPDKVILQRLSNVILIEDISDKTPDKLSRKEYPFLSDRQLVTRIKREFSLEDDTINFLHQKEVKKMDSAFRKRTENKE